MSDYENQFDQNNTIVLTSGNTDDSVNDNDVIIDLSNFTINDMSSTFGSGSCYTIDTTNYPSSYSTIGTGSTLTWTSGYPESSVNLGNDGITMKEGTDIKIGEKSLLDTISKIEERLAILKPNPELESRWEELKELGNRYRELEKDLTEKEKMWDILKKS